MFERVDEIKQARARNAMAANREIADQSRELVTIVREVPINLELERCAVHDYDRTAAVGIFQELEFRTLLGKLPGDQADVTAVGGEVAMQLSDGVSVVTTEELEQLADCISKAKMIAVDVETDGLDVHRCQLVGIAVATAEDTGYYIPLRHRDSELADPARLIASSGRSSRHTQTPSPITRNSISRYCDVAGTTI